MMIYDTTTNSIWQSALQIPLMRDIFNSSAGMNSSTFILILSARVKNTMHLFVLEFCRAKIATYINIMAMQSLKHRSINME